LGTASVLVYVRGKGIVLREPSVIAMVRDSKDVKAVGAEAYRMLGRTPGNIIAVRPLKDGVIADYTLTERMLTMFLKKVLSPMARFFKPQVMVGVPSGVTEVERMAVVRAVVDRWGGIDVLVNAAGIIASGTIETTTLEEWDRMFAINTRAVFYLMHVCTPYLVERKGNIVNVSSVTGLRAFPNVLAYCASKAAVDHLTRAAALELAPKGVRVNAVNPGVVVTELHRRGGMDEKAYAEFLERSKSTHPLGRVGKPEEVADLILFLASPHAGWITGDTISIDGGRAQTCLR
jgi:NAD(P)-dependent dehydrogenase (short-subunit alcohol dehydrogenase family)